MKTITIEYNEIICSNQEIINADGIWVLVNDIHDNIVKLKLQVWGRLKAEGIDTDLITNIMTKFEETLKEVMK